MNAEVPGPVRHTVLLIEDNAGDARLIREMISEDPEAPFELHFAERLAHGLDFLANRETGLVLLDLSLPDSLGLETFAKVFEHSPSVPIIVLIALVLLTDGAVPRSPAASEPLIAPRAVSRS